MWGINFLYTVWLTQFNMMSFMSGLPSCFFSALFALTFWVRLFVIIGRWRLAAVMAVFMKLLFQLCNSCIGFFKLGSGFFEFDSKSFNCLLLSLKCFK
jgi:hypothetical protein